MVSRIFIYGRFQDEPGIPLSFLPPPPELPSVAIEILREFSALEFIGKVYVLTPGRNWQPVTPLGVGNFDWFKKYQSQSRQRSKFYFAAQDGDLWRVLFLRQESDDQGPYLAAALKHE
jgi:hypothetical protein